MQDEDRNEMKELFEGACGFPADQLAALIEMEHRANGEPRDELVSIAARVLADRVEAFSLVSDRLIFEESDKMMVSATIHRLPIETIRKVLETGIDADLEGGDTNVM